MFDVSKEMDGVRSGQQGESVPELLNSILLAQNTLQSFCDMFSISYSIENIEQHRRDIVQYFCAAGEKANGCKHEESPINRTPSTASMTTRCSFLMYTAGSAAMLTF
ncbi:hypothetical protein AVEN_162025-1 [Araneus ventricosus]|uniref:Uncharacterized protein n=1 Tax=Araneus ventricosus TaxID=182803 RepID=A0A4Y2F7Z4_ARAVE|nr:hypothetical protein AVEN_162025-1 [Araneus ventricosus]